MIGLDTNVLVRFVTRDDPQQWKRVDAYLTQNCTSSDPGWVSCIVLCEVVWVLSRGYEYDKKDIVSLLEKLCLTAELQLESHDCVRRAIAAFKRGGADFSDYFIGQRNKAQGCETTATLERKAARDACFVLV